MTQAKILRSLESILRLSKCPMSVRSLTWQRGETGALMTLLNNPL